MGKKQIEVGNRTETKVAEVFKKNGYWAYICPKHNGGQPVDIIALKNNTNWLVDAKHVRAEESSFPFSRIEPNQFMSLDYVTNFANIQNTGFGVYFERDMKVYYLDYKKCLEMAKKGLKSINMKDMPLLEDIINA